MNRIRVSRSIGHIVIGNPSNRRVQMFCRAVNANRLATPVVIPYVDLLDPDRNFFDRDLLRNAIEYSQASFSRTCLRIESPGESWEVERRFIACGSEHLPPDFAGERISRRAAMRLRERFGRIRFLRQAHAGFEHALQSIETILDSTALVQAYNSPCDIRLAFDKPKCHSVFQENGLPVAEAFDRVVSLDDLLAKMEMRRFNKVMIKYAYGSSASCIIALSIDPNGRLRATTTMEVLKIRGQTMFFNNLIPRTYTQPKIIEKLVNGLCREGVQVERWLPRLSWRGRVFDFRVVVIAGRACHIVVRTSSGPFTNLHLGNKRGNLDEIRRICGGTVWNQLLHTAKTAATNCFRKSHYLGFDLLVEAGSKNVKLIEANTFGDLIPGVTFSGQSTYEHEVRTMTTKR